MPEPSELIPVVQCPDCGGVSKAKTFFATRTVAEDGDEEYTCPNCGEKYDPVRVKFYWRCAFVEANKVPE